MSEQKVNIPLLRKAVEWAEAEAAKPPELCEWVQAWWRTAPDASEGSWEWRVRNGRHRWDAVARSHECGTTYCIAGYIAEQVAGRVESGWSQIAQEALGIHALAASRLFDAVNTIQDVRRIAEEIAGERL